MQTVTVENSLFVGRSDGNPSCFRQVGILLPVSASQGYGISPHTCGPLGGSYLRGFYGPEHPTGSNPTIATEVRVTSTTFRNFRFNCGESFVLETTMRGGTDSHDVVPPLFFSKITIDGASRFNLAHLPPPDKKWIKSTKCVVMDCDGPKHVLIHDLDGTLTGLGPDASVLARAEFMNKLRDDDSKYTWYNIPSKMLYDPAPYNNPDDPGWDMSKYAHLNEGDEGGGMFSYRRLARTTSVRDELDRDTTRMAVDATGEATVDPASRIAYSTVGEDGEIRAITSAEYHGGDGNGTHLDTPDGRQLASATESDWKNRMVFYQGDERTFFPSAGRICDPSSAIYDPMCRTERKTHREVAYRGYGTYRGETDDKQCTLNTRWNAWSCSAAVLKPARFIVESMDEDHTSRNLAPVALATGGYVDLMNAGMDHQNPNECGGYGCLKRLMTFHGTVAVNRSYDLAFTGTNPQHIRLYFPSGGGETTLAGHETTRVLIALFYSNPEKLEVFYRQKLVLPLEHHMKAANSYNFTMRKPVITDPCGSNAFAAWENKLYVLVCGGVPGVEIKTVKKVVLSLGMELSTEDFFDEHYLVRNLASLFGIPADRMRVPKIVAGSLKVDVEILSDDLCKEVETCGPHGSCFEGDCVCDDGWKTPDTCAGGECECSKQISTCPDGCETCHATNQSCTSCSASFPLLYEDRCYFSCPLGSLPDPAAGTCVPCHPSCRSCMGGRADQCTSCDSIGMNAYQYHGQCVLSCPVGSYSDENRVCHDCSARCKTCSGPLATDCLSCEPNACMRTSCPEGVVFPVLDGGQCLSNWCRSGIEVGRRVPRYRPCCPPAPTHPLTISPTLSHLAVHQVGTPMQVECVMRAVPLVDCARGRGIKIASTRPATSSSTPTAPQAPSALVALARKPARPVAIPRLVATALPATTTTVSSANTMTQASVYLVSDTSMLVWAGTMPSALREGARSLSHGSALY